MLYRGKSIAIHYPNHTYILVLEGGGFLRMQTISFLLKRCVTTFQTSDRWMCVCAHWMLYYDYLHNIRTKGYASQFFRWFISKVTHSVNNLDYSFSVWFFFCYPRHHHIDFNLKLWITFNKNLSKWQINTKLMLNIQMNFCI